MCVYVCVCVCLSVCGSCDVRCSYAFPDALGVRHDCLGVRSAETCQATCTEAGYTYAAGSSAETWTCLPTGSLDGQLPTCQRIACTDLALSTTFTHNCQGLRFEDTCTVSCGPGYTLDGASGQFQCQADGNITGTLPTCVGNPCTNTLPTDPAFDTSGCDGKTTSQTCLVTCNPGYTPNVAMLTCDPSGFLLGTLPSCKPEPCPVNTTLAVSSLTDTCEGVAYGATCAVFCAPGFILSNGSTIEEWKCMRNPDGILFLKGTLPTCEPQACDSGLPVPSPNLVDNCSSLTTGQSCTQECAVGYSSTAGANTYTCTE
ncbi:CSMD3, partial [Symbiodinium sp. KB8]